MASTPFCHCYPSESVLFDEPPPLFFLYHLLEPRWFFVRPHESPPQQHGSLPSGLFECGFFEPMSGSLADTLESEFSPRRLLGTLTGSHMTFLIPSCLHHGLFDPLVSKPITCFCFLFFIIFSHEIPLIQSSLSPAWRGTSNEPENIFYLLKPAVNMMASVSLPGGTRKAPTNFGMGAWQGWKKCFEAETQKALGMSLHQFPKHLISIDEVGWFPCI